jgi:hypothetical protein
MYSPGKNSNCIEKARIALLPLMDEISQAFIADLIQERDEAWKLEDQWRRRVWKIQSAWHNAKLPDENVDWRKPPKTTAEQAKELIEKWEKESPSLEEQKAKALNWALDKIENN